MGLVGPGTRVNQRLHECGGSNDKQARRVNLVLNVHAARIGKRVHQARGLIHHQQVEAADLGIGKVGRVAICRLIPVVDVDLKAEGYQGQVAGDKA